MDFFIHDNEDILSYEATGPIVPDAMDCMRCGLCLSHCPTFQLTKDEQEGPRQRIRTLETLVIKQDNVSEIALQHLNNCTLCRACESICPSQMNYHELFNEAQQKLTQPKRRGWLATFALKCIEHKALMQVLLPLAWLYQVSALKKIVKYSRVFKWLNIEPLAAFTRRPEFKTMQSTQKPLIQPIGKVALFTGCISEHFDRQTLDDAATVLRKLGYEVEVPTTQTCCGAIHAHNGDIKTAQQLMKQNRTCFNDLDVDAIVYCASGCGAELNDYARWLELEGEAAFRAPLFEIIDFVAKHWDDTKVGIRPTFKRVFVHEPCSHRNVLKTQASIYDVLNKIPGLMVKPLESNHLCCGAGGTYMLTHPALAQSMRESIFKAIDYPAMDYLVSTNIGCALHLSSQLKNGKRVEVIHPISLLANQLSVIPQSQRV